MGEWKMGVGWGWKYWGRGVCVCGGGGPGVDLWLVEMAEWGSYLLLPVRMPRTSTMTLPSSFSLLLTAGVQGGPGGGPWQVEVAECPLCLFECTEHRRRRYCRRFRCR